MESDAGFRYVAPVDNLQLGTLVAYQFISLYNMAIGDFFFKLLHIMRIKEIMTADVVAVSPETKITEVAKILHENKFHGVPVVDKGKLVGVITETDFFIKGDNDIYLPAYIDFLKNIRQGGEPEGEKEKNVAALMNATAKDIMTSECITLHPDSDVQAMFMLIKEGRIHSVPVVMENWDLVGIVTQADVIKLI